MVSIVYGHSIGAFSILDNASFESSYIWLIAPMKFGTICFYLISGFLLGEKFTETPSLTYLKRRYDNTFRPYIITLVCYLLFYSLRYFSGEDKVQNFQDYGLHLIEDSITIIFFTNYWFVINLFISLSIILLFKKYLFSYTFPALAFAVTLFYSFNIHAQYFEPRHGAALFGFIFYLWLGIFINKHKNAFIDFIDKTSITAFVIVTGLLLGLNVFEAYVLRSINSIDPLNTLKLSNQLYSLVIFSLIIKFRNINLPAVFNPKKETYGIYLYHPFFITILYKVVYSFSHTYFLRSDFVIMISMFAFVIIYSLTTCVVKCLNTSPIQWLEEFRIRLNPQKT